MNKFVFNKLSITGC